jgi:hypothetical protein
VRESSGRGGERGSFEYALCLGAGVSVLGVQLKHNQLLKWALLSMLSTCSFIIYEGLYQVRASDSQVRESVHLCSLLRIHPPQGRRLVAPSSTSFLAASGTCRRLTCA